MFYTILAWLLWLLSLPFVLLLSFKQKFRHSLKARFLLVANKPFSSPQKYLFHACSLGEVRAILPLVKQLGGVVTTTTQTGFDEAKKAGVEVRFLPFECLLPFWLVKVEKLVVFEAELWLNLFATAKKNGAKTILLNARISQKSFTKYQTASFYYKRLFSFVDLVLAQSEADAERLQSLGAKNIEVLGNVKSAFLPSPTRVLSRNFQHIVLIASSHKNEENRILQNLSLPPSTQLIITPRHPERFEEVARLASAYAEQNALSFTRFSQTQTLRSQVVLCDKMGELINLYAIADIVLMCGSFEDNIGGHNPIEAAQFNCAILSGRHFFNQLPLYACVDGIEICGYEELTRRIWAFCQGEKDAPKRCKITNQCDPQRLFARIA